MKTYQVILQFDSDIGHINSFIRTYHIKAESEKALNDILVEDYSDVKIISVHCID